MKDDALVVVSATLEEMIKYAVMRCSIWYVVQPSRLVNEEEMRLGALSLRSDCICCYETYVGGDVDTCYTFLASEGSVWLLCTGQLTFS